MKTAINTLGANTCAEGLHILLPYFLYSHWGAVQLKLFASSGNPLPLYLAIFGHGQSGCVLTSFSSAYW